MAALSGFSIGCQVCSARFFYSAWPELQHLPSLLTSGISAQQTAHPHTYFLPGMVESYPIDVQLSIWPKTQRTALNRLLELSLYSLLLCSSLPWKFQLPRQPWITISVSSIQWVFHLCLGSNALCCKLNSAPRQKARADVGLTLCFSSLKDHIPALCLKTTASCILSSFKVVHGRKVSLTTFIPSWMQPQGIVSLKKIVPVIRMNLFYSRHNRTWSSVFKSLSYFKV